VVTELGRFDLDRAHGCLIARELAEGVDLDAVRERTGIPIVAG
jgi:acyl CoA:acetate/3-ketoacid CoA transferase beta subunit